MWFWVVANQNTPRLIILLGGIVHSMLSFFPPRHNNNISMGRWFLTKHREGKAQVAPHSPNHKPRHLTNIFIEYLLTQSIKLSAYVSFNNSMKNVIRGSALIHKSVSIGWVENFRLTRHFIRKTSRDPAQNGTKLGFFHRWFRLVDTMCGIKNY